MNQLQGVDIQRPGPHFTILVAPDPRRTQTARYHDLPRLHLVMAATDKVICRTACVLAAVFPEDISHDRPLLKLGTAVAEITGGVPSPSQSFAMICTAMLLAADPLIDGTF